MTGSQIIVLATPVFLGLITIELAVGYARGRNTYRLHDALSSIGLGMVSQLTGLLTKLLSFGIYVTLYREAALVKLDAASPWVWLTALLLYDLCYYWFHRASHRVALLWAAHAVHHQSEDYNLSTALRQTSTGWIIGWVFYLPLAVLGIPPTVFVAVALADLLYQFWVHTQQIGRLGWFDRWFCSPSNHRVHHAVNDGYIDKNYGGVLIVWDRLFGTFTEERDDEPLVYGTRQPLRSWDPLWANLQVYASLAGEARRAGRWRDRLLVWWMPPGWRPSVTGALGTRRPFDLARVERFDPAASPVARLGSVALFLPLLAGSAWLLWYASALSAVQLALGTAAVTAGLSLIAWLGYGRQAAPHGNAQRA